MKHFILKFLPNLIFVFFCTQIYAQVNLNNGLIAYYPFSGNANDFSGNNNNAIVNGATLTPDRFGNNNSAYHFNGINNFMKVVNSSSLQVGNTISLCAWVKPTDYNRGTCANNMIIMKGGEYLPNNFFIRFADRINGCTQTPNYNNEEFYGGSNTSSAIANAPIVQLNNWYSVVLTYDGSNLKIFVNCQLRNTLQVNNLNFNSSYDMYFGRMFDPQRPNLPYWFNGDLDEIRIYNRALNQNEVNVYGNCDIPCPADTNTTISKCENQIIQLNPRVGNTYSWSPSVGLSATNIQSPICFTNVSTTYIATITNTTTNCVYHDTINVKVNPLPFSNLRDTSICNGDSLQLSLQPGNTYNWSPNMNINNTTISDPTIWPNITTDYSVVITNSFGCIYKDTVKITVNECGCQDSCNWSLTGNSSIKPLNFIGSKNNADFKIRTNNIQRMVVNAAGNIGIGTNTPLKLLDVNGEVIVRTLPPSSAGDNLVLANTFGELKSLNPGQANQYLSGNGTWQNLPNINTGTPNVDQGLTIDNSIIQLGDNCGNGGGLFQSDREININNRNLYFNTSKNGKIFIGTTDGKGQSCKELAARLEISTNGLPEAVNDYTTPQPSTSGLRFTNLTANDNKIENQFGGVLSLDEDGDVIWVKANSNNLIESKLKSILERVEVLESELKSTKQENLVLKNKLQQIDITISHNSDYIEQNTPNPFVDYTSINYNIISNFNRAEIVLMTIKGEIVKTVQLKEKGKGVINISINLLAKGVYTYSLVLDGKVVETKRMIKQ